MPHIRDRFAVPLVKKLLKFWPAIGIIGPRQSGKTFLIENLLEISNIVSMDEFELRTEAELSPRSFLAKQQLPVVFDEVQKAPNLFDAIKMTIDKKRIPGQYILSGSTSFSSRLGIRESLTGRIGILSLSPMTLAEIAKKDFRPLKSYLPNPSDSSLRFDTETVMKAALAGGMPVPAFLRDTDRRALYWNSWLDTTLHRDLSKHFKKNYDADFAYSLLSQMSATLSEGELPTLKHFKWPAQRVRRYLSSMEEIFLVKKISCHPLGIGKEIWLLMDSGLAAHLMKHQGEGHTLSLIRNFLWNEWITLSEYQGKHLNRTYYKSAQGSPVDAILDGVPFRIVATTSAVTRQLKWEERSLAGAMKKLSSKVGYLVAPVEKASFPKKGSGIGILPWGWWS